MPQAVSHLGEMGSEEMGTGARGRSSVCPTRADELFAQHLLSLNESRKMTDPRNVAHDKKIQQEKKHRGEEIAPGADKTPQPGKKTHMEHHASDEVGDEAPGSDGEKASD